MPTRHEAPQSQFSDRTHPGSRAARIDAARVAEARLRCSSRRELGRIRCDFHEGVLTLRGRLSTFFLTQLAQTEVAHVPGVEVVVNRIEVA